jgi:hypothetical protein
MLDHRELMSRIVVTVLLLIFCATELRSQSTMQQPSRLGMLSHQQTITGGVGVTFIDGEPYYLFHLMPELAFGKVGVGLDLNIRVGKDGKIRKEDFNEVYDYLRIIRYVRYGMKHDSFYVRAGALDYTRLGHGYIMYMYRNSASYDLRRIGIELDVDFEKYGFESMYSDIGGAGVLGVRGYLRPMQYTRAAAIPIIGGLETGVTFASDLQADANKTWGDTIGSIRRTDDGGSLSIIGVDAGFPLLSLSSLRSTFYADYAKIVNYGGGAAVGISVDFSGLGPVTLGAKYERRFVGDQFLPSYFGALYEHERYQIVDTSRFLSKAQALKTAQRFQGYYGELLLSIFGTLNIIGGYQSPVGQRNAGTIHLELETGNALPGILLTGGYDKKNVGSVFKVDNNSLFYAQIGYKPLPYMVVSMLYQWTFAEEKEESTGRVVGYKVQKRVEPKVGFIINF